MAASPANTQVLLRVSPNARKSEFAGWTADEKGRPVLLVRLHAPPVDGKANEELIRFLADFLECPKSHVVLLRGTSSRLKLIDLPVELAARLPTPF